MIVKKRNRLMIRHFPIFLNAVKLNKKYIKSKKDVGKFSGKCVMCNILFV